MKFLPVLLLVAAVLGPDAASAQEWACVKRTCRSTATQTASTSCTPGTHRPATQVLRDPDCA